MLFRSRFMPCPDCGASIDHLDSGEHRCEQERWLDYQLFQLRDECDRFDEELGAYLDSPHGRFEQWYAARSRRSAGA
jgi:hypothetical protein